MKNEDTEKENKELLQDIINYDQENFFKKDYVLGAIIFKKNGEKVVFSIDNFLSENNKIKISEKQKKEFKFNVEYFMHCLEKKEWINEFVKEKTKNKIKEEVEKQKLKKVKLKLIQGGLSEKNKKNEVE